MPRLTELAHKFVRAVLRPGEIAVDATAGNGHDTRVLSAIVGPEGKVFAFDVQPEAITRTAAALGHATGIALLARDHAEIRDAIPPEWHGRISAVMFNLGYLPGGDHSTTTQPASTLAAISTALELLRPGGVLTVLAYPGHPGGAEETQAVAKLLRELPNTFRVREEPAESGQPSAPRLFVVHKQTAIG